MTELPEERRWRQRVPLTAVRAALIFGLLSLIVIEVAVADPPCTFDPGCRLPLGSWQAAAAAGLQFGVLAGIVLLPIWPRIGVWLGAVIALGMSVPIVEASAIPAAWLLNGVGFAAIGVVEVAFRRRQGHIAAEWATSPETRPILDAGRRPLRGIVPAVIIGVLTVAGCGVLGYLYVTRVAEIRAAGSPADPSWLAGVTGSLAVIGTVITWVILRRGRARYRLLRTPQPRTRLRLGEVGDVILVTTLEDREFRAPLGLLRDLQPVRPGVRPEPKRVLVDQPDVFAQPPPPPSERRVARGPLAWIDDVWGGGEPITRAGRGGAEVVAAGQLTDGRSLAVSHEGRWLISTLPLRDPWTLRRVRQWSTGVPDDELARE